MMVIVAITKTVLNMVRSRHTLTPRRQTNQVPARRENYGGGNWCKMESGRACGERMSCHGNQLGRIERLEWRRTFRTPLPRLEQSTHDGKTTREQLAELKRLSRAVRCSPSMAPVPISHSRPWPAASRSSNLPRKMPSIVQAGRRRTQRGWTLCTRWPIFSVRRQEISGCLGVCDEFGEPRIL
jgi:hypothetical protein